MKKTAVLLILILVLYTSGCAKTEPQNTKEPTSQAVVSASESSDVTPSISDELSSGPVSVPSVNPIKAASIYVDEVNEERGTLYLGQSQNDACHVFYANDIEMTGNDFQMSTDYMAFTLANGKVDGILVASDSEMPTTLGLDFGDSVEDMEGLYGTEYIIEKLDTDETVYEYQIDDHYFYVRFLDGKVDIWGIHK